MTRKDLTASLCRSVDVLENRIDVPRNNVQQMHTNVHLLYSMVTGNSCNISGRFCAILFFQFPSPPRRGSMPDFHPLYHRRTRPVYIFRQRILCRETLQ